MGELEIASRGYVYQGNALVLRSPGYCHTVYFSWLECVPLFGGGLVSKLNGWRETERHFLCHLCRKVTGNICTELPAINYWWLVLESFTLSSYLEVWPKDSCQPALFFTNPLSIGKFLGKTQPTELTLRRCMDFWRTQDNLIIPKRISQSTIHPLNFIRKSSAVCSNTSVLVITINICVPQGK